MPDLMQHFYPESRFGGYTRVDGTVAFMLRVRSLLTPDSVVLDIGCGRGDGKLHDPVRIRRDLCNLHDVCGRIIGIDPDPAAAMNPLVDEFRRIQDPRHWPVESGSIDLACADYVVEHVDDVDAFFSECSRVLKPGGYLCLRTPNLLSYFGLISKAVPNRFHSKVVTKLQDNRQKADVFPTRYRCNTLGKLRRTLRRHGFDACVIGHEPEPAYLSSSRILFAMGVLHQKLAPSMFRVNLLAYAKKL
jgi:SAM-dependent methyltransferase